MKTLCIAQCGNRIIWKKYPNAGQTPAKDAYIGGFSRKTQEYAKHFYPNVWCILSAKYGFLWPDELINDYNVSFKYSKTNPILISKLVESAEQKKLFDYDEIVIVAGNEYVKYAVKVFPNKKIVQPLKGTIGIGVMMQRLKNAVKTGIKIC